MKSHGMRAFLILLGMTLIGVFFFFPLYWTFITSFKTSSQIFVEKPLFIIDTLYLSNYIEIFQKTNVATFFLNSVVVSGATTVISLVIATMAGFGFCRYSFIGKNALQNSVLIVRMIPALVYTIPYYIIYNKLHLLDTIIGLILAYIAFALPLAIWLAINFFSEIPKELYESAEIDGCSEYRIYSSIALPLVKAGLVVIAILVFIGAWNEFGLALVLQASDAKKTLPIGIASMIQTHKDTPSGSLAAAGMLAMIPAVILSLTTQKYIVKGTMAGAVKG
ncbi:MAG TPA: carbohydrate ABC transporter permease [Clostridiales bacterium]|nr:carbohydrate ABC transporter permease [Clostridiales bacterium]